MEATIAVTAAGAAATLAALWGSRRKRAFGTVSLVPWTGIMFVGVTALVIGAAHLATLLGGRDKMRKLIALARWRWRWRWWARRRSRWELPRR